MATKDSNLTRIFISYSHQDAEWLKRLRIHLKPLESQYGVDVWDDTRIESGSNWHKEIEKAIGTARIVLLLVSADFIASDFIRFKELPSLLAAAKRGGATILPVIVSPCRYKEEAFSQFQSVNPPSKPLTVMNKHDQEELFVKVAGDIEKLLIASRPIAPTSDAQAPARELGKFTKGFVEDKPWRQQTAPFPGLAQDPSTNLSPNLFTKARAGWNPEWLSRTSPEVANRPSSERKPDSSVIASMEIGFAPYITWTRDWEVRGRSADGVLTAANLDKHIEAQLSERAEEISKGDREKVAGLIEINIALSRRILTAMEAKQASGIRYVPKQVLEFSLPLRRLYTELLNLDSGGPGTSDIGLDGEISQVVIDRARSRCRAVDGALRNFSELARKLGMF